MNLLVGVTAWVGALVIYFAIRRFNKKAVVDLGDIAGWVVAGIAGSLFPIIILLCIARAFGWYP